MDSVPFHQNAVVVRQFIQFARLSGLFMVAISLTMMFGWWKGLPDLTTNLPGSQSVNASAALGFALSGAALMLSQSPRFGLQVVSRLLSIGVGGIGFITILAYALSLNMPGGRMAELVAVAMVLLGGLGLLVSIGRALIWREACAMGVLVIAMLGLSFYGFSLAGKNDFEWLRVPIPSAILLLLAALGWMSSVPTTGLTRVATSDTFGGQLARYLLLPSMLLPVAFTFIFELLRNWLEISETYTFAFAALFTSGTVACLIWWVARLLDKVERQHRKSIKLQDDANTDKLTNLANRRTFDVTLTSLLRSRRENDVVFSLLMLDLDKFKNYNDDFGHLAGDEALRIAGKILRASVRPGDMAARYGGEEFALLLPDADASQAYAIAGRILDGFRAFPWRHRAVTISIGIAEARTNIGASELVSRADRALYEAKNGGRDRAVISAEATTSKNI